MKTTQLFLEQELPIAAKLVKQGELIAFPTETVYGLGANALDEIAVKEVYEAKGRPSDNPLIIHVETVEQIKKYVSNFPFIAEKLAKHFWPGPLTMIFNIKPGTFPEVVTGGLTTAAFRIPNNRLTLELIHQAGVPLVGPSANTSGKPSPTTAEHVYHDLQGKIAGVLDGGATQIGIESTVLDLTTEVPTILRPGLITKQELKVIIGKVAVDQHLLNEKEQPKAPGMKYKHYSPDTAVWIISMPTDWEKAIHLAKERRLKIGLFADEKIVDTYRSQITATFSFGEDTAINAAKYLFAGLRELDQMAVDVIFAQGFAERSMALAYMNRLKKAAGQKVFSNQTFYSE